MEEKPLIFFQTLRDGGLLTTPNEEYGLFKGKEWDILVLHWRPLVDLNKPDIESITKKEKFLKLFDVSITKNNPPIPSSSAPLETYIADLQRLAEITNQEYDRKLCSAIEKIFARITEYNFSLDGEHEIFKSDFFENLKQWRATKKIIYTCYCMTAARAKLAEEAGFVLKYLPCWQEQGFRRERKWHPDFYRKILQARLAVA